MAKTKKTARRTSTPAGKQPQAPLPPEGGVPPLTTEALAEMSAAQAPTSLEDAPEPSQEPSELESERRWRRLIARESEEPVQGAEEGQDATRSLENDQEPVQEPTARRSGWKLEERPPLRPETKAEETAGYPGRLNRWEEAKQLAESRKGHEEEDAAHRTTCPSPSTCQHPAHVVPRRQWREHTKHDLRHLRACDKEDVRECPDLDISHLLPPRPLDVAVEFCCEHRCYPRTDLRSLTECVYQRVQDRAQRQLELRRFGKQAFTMKGGGFVGASVVLSQPIISESTAWAYQAASSIYDPARTPLRES